MKPCCNQISCNCQKEPQPAIDSSTIQWLQEQNVILKKLYIQLKAEYDSKLHLAIEPKGR